MFRNSKWIWTNDPQKKNRFVRFKIEFEAPKKLAAARFQIAAETKYYLYLNGELTVFDGGLHRESSPGSGYYDEVPLAVRPGKNVVLIDVWYWGNGGRNNTAFPGAGVLFGCEELGIYSGEHIECGVLQAYFEPQGEQPAYLYGGYNVGFDANKDRVDYQKATVVANYGEGPFGIPQKRPIPLFAFGKNVSAEYTRRGQRYEVSLPHAMQFSPYLKVKAKGGERIGICSDHYGVHGGPGDSDHIYRGHRYEYVCRAGEQEYGGYNYIFGEKALFTVPDGVEVLELGYRESGYDCKVVNVPVTDDALLNRLMQKCARTLKVCMRENFMDCPDRERGQWIGDVSVQAPQVFLCLSENAKLLLRKAIIDFFTLRKGDVLVGNVPGDHFSELPSQSLNAISEVGMLANYYANTKDKEMLRLAFEPAVAYLKLWGMGEDGFIVTREGNWNWFDHNYNVDEKILENCWYYSALKYALFMAQELKDGRYTEFLQARKESIERHFEQAFWTGRGYSSGKVMDDRANAMAILTGLADMKDAAHRNRLHDVLVTVFNSTTYMEGYVLEALCVLGYKEDAYKRMMSRYYPLIVNENSTIWEDFFILGTKNHAWSGAPLTIVWRYFKELIRYTASEA